MVKKDMKDMKDLKFMSYYTDILLFSSIFYFACGILDCTITMCGYMFYGKQFFSMELNVLVCYLLELGIPPVHMFLIPSVLIFLSLYLNVQIHKADQAELDTINYTHVWGIFFAISLIIMMGLLHLYGFLTWFYFGGF
jgi:hypothetical protein